MFSLIVHTMKLQFVTKVTNIHYLSGLVLHSVEILGFFCHTKFTRNRCGRIQSLKICYFDRFRGSDFYFYEFSYISKADIDQTNKIQSPQNGKKAVLNNFYIFQNQFHIKLKRLCKTNSYRHWSL